MGLPRIRRNVSKHRKPHRIPVTRVRHRHPKLPDHRSPFRHMQIVRHMHPKPKLPDHRSAFHHMQIGQPRSTQRSRQSRSESVSMTAGWRTRQNLVMLPMAAFFAELAEVSRFGNKVLAGISAGQSIISARKVGQSPRSQEGRADRLGRTTTIFSNFYEVTRQIFYSLPDFRMTRGKVVDDSY
jgi:hypothetical protein